MVIVKDYAVRENADGEEFIALILQGGLEMVQSQETGRFYATVRKASVTSTLDEDTAKQMIGQKIPGQIVREECDPYPYVTEETGEELILTHTYVYSPEATAPVATQPAHTNQENGVEATV